MFVIFVITLICTVILAVAFIILLIAGISQDSDACKQISLVCMFLAVIFGIVSDGSYSIKKQVQQFSEERAKLEVEASTLYEHENYAAFLDGQEVDMDDIDVTQYVISIDYDRKKILLSTINRSDYHTTFFYPIYR